MLLALAPCARAFSLPGEGRRMAVKNTEPCKASCDEGRDYKCDEHAPDDPNEYDSDAGASSCDMHPTTSCDHECGPGPSPPPQAPWHGLAGTWPAPPPPPPPADWEGVAFLSVVLVLVFVLFCFGLVACHRRHNVPHNTSGAWRLDATCWYCLPWLKHHGRDSERDTVVYAQCKPQSEQQVLRTNNPAGETPAKPTLAMQFQPVKMVPLTTNVAPGR